jgi:hypothetical protein
VAKLVGFRLGSEEIYVNPDHVVLVEKSGEGSIIHLIGRRSNPPAARSSA